MKNSLLLACCMAGMLAAPAWAEEPAAPPQAHGNFLVNGPMGGVWQQDQMLGDAWGARTWLGQYGVTVGLTEVSEILGNTSGGVKRTGDYDGLTTLTLQMDTGKALGWDGGTFNASGMHVHGTNLSANNLMNLQTASGIEADDGFRLWELWYDQTLLNNTTDIKVGQQSVDQEFMGSQYSALYVNTMFGWPMVPSADLLGGGPAYPLSSLGARVKFTPEASPWTVLAGVFDDNPGGLDPRSSDDAQKLDDRGTNFRLKDSALFLGEIQFAYPTVGDTQRAGDTVLPGTYKLGFWYDAGKFADQRYGTDGLSLADPSSNGIARLHRGNYSIYGVIDQALWRDAEGEKAIGFFVRPMISPNDRNEIHFSVNGGLNFKGLIEGRGDDVLGLGVAYTTVSDRARDFDGDTIAAGTPQPKRSNETVLEATYQYALAPWWNLQPDFQYVFNPGGGIADPNSPTGDRIKNETIVGIRTTLTF